jgi:hypothetical protein
VVFLATRLEEIVAAFLGDFFQGFQAVGDEAGADHVDAADALAAPFVQGRRGVGLQPFGLAEARLEADLELLGLQVQAFGQQAAGLVAFAEIGSPRSRLRLGRPWKLMSRRSWSPSEPLACQCGAPIFQRAR